MNSLLQIWFSLPAVRRAILRWQAPVQQVVFLEKNDR
jgi:hypothetical protein